MKQAATWALFSIALVSLVGSRPAEAQQEAVKGPPTDTAAWDLARYAVDLKYENLPADVIAITKRRILDALACALGASTSKPMSILRDAILSEGGKPESTLIGSGQKTSAVNAAMVNGSLIRYLDFNDTYWSKGYMHPSNSIAEALAVAERQHASGKDLIVATVLAYEIQSRMADTFTLPGFEQHSGGGFTAPLVAGKLLGMNAEQIANAVGLGASHNFALAGDYGIGYVSNMKAFGYAAGSGSGVLAALLAQKGFTGPVTIIESYQRTFEKNASLTSLVAPRTDYAIVKAVMKPFEADHFALAPITGAIQLVKEHSIKPDQISKIFIKGLPDRRTTPAPRRITELTLTKEDADHNIPYMLAMGIIDGTVGPAQYAAEQWKDPKVQELMGKMEFQGDAELTKGFPERLTSIVEITTKENRVYTQRVDLPKGVPGNPLTDQELEAKFNGLVLKLMPKSQADQIIKTVHDLDKLTDIAGLTKLLVAPKSTQ